MQVLSELTYRSKAQIIEKTISVIWFYKRYHLEIEIGGNCYSVLIRKIEAVRPLIDFINSTDIGRLHFYRFVIKADAKMVEELEKNLNSDKPNLPFDSCCGSVRTLLNQYTNLRVPFLYSRLPAMMGYYLLNAYERGNASIEAVEHYPRDQEREVGEQARSFDGRYYAHMADFGFVVMACTFLFIAATVAMGPFIKLADLV